MLPVMTRLAGLLVLAVALLQGSGIDVRLSELSCAGEHHEGGGGTSGCSPECATCPCCVRVRFPPVALAACVVEPLPEVVAWSDLGSGRLPAPPPRGILHVPRPTA
jgi:hypothetical protein